MVQQNNSGGGGSKPINVSVNRATVARADVTRMSIDGKNQGDEARILEDIKNSLSGGDSLKSKLDGIHKAIEQCCVAGGGGGAGAAQAAATKKLGDAHSGAADAVGEVAGESGKLVAAVVALQDSIRVLISQQGSLSVSTGDAAENVEKAGGAALAGQKAQEAQYNALSKVLFKFEREGEKLVIRFAEADMQGKGLQGRFTALWETLKEARMAEYVKTLNLATQKLQNFTAELVDTQTQFRKFWDDATGQYEEAANGLGTTFSLLTDELMNIRDRFQGINRDTERMVIEAIRGTGEGQAALVMGKSLEEIGAFTRETRDAVQEDVRLQSMFGYKGANDAAIKSFKLLTRRGIQDDIAQSMTANMARKRMELTANIVQNTGLTLEAVKALEEETTLSIDNLVNAGALQGEQQIDYARELLASARAQGPHMEQMVLELIAAKGFSGNLSENTRKMLLKIGEMGEAEDIMANIMRAEAGTQVRNVEALNNIGQGITKFGQDMGAASPKMIESMGQTQDTLGAMAGDLKGMRDATKPPTGKPKEDPLRTAMDKLSQNIAKYFPSFTGLGIAIGFNVAALVANTLALLRGGKIPGFGGPKGPKAPKWTTSRGAAPAKAVGKRGVGAAIRGAGGRALGMGGRALGLLGAGGAVAGAGLAGYELGSFLNEATANEKGRRASDWVSDKFSSWFGPDTSDITKTITIEDINKSRKERGLPPITPKTPKTAAPTPRTPASPTPSVAKTLTQEERMDIMNKTLEKISKAIDQGNVYASQMVSGIGRITANGKPAVAGDVAFVAPGSPSG